jgi:hypothetical protein
MAVGAIARCLRQYGEETLVTALQCVTQTANNKPGALSARVIKALCSVLGDDHALRDSGLALFDIFDGIDLLQLAESSAAAGASKKMKPHQFLAERVRLEIVRLRPTASVNLEPDVHIAPGQAVTSHRSPASSL